MIPDNSLLSFEGRFCGSQVMGNDFCTIVFDRYDKKGAFLTADNGNVAKYWLTRHLIEVDHVETQSRTAHGDFCPFTETASLLLFSNNRSTESCTRTYTLLWLGFYILLRGALYFFYTCTSIFSTERRLYSHSQFLSYINTSYLCACTYFDRTRAHWKFEKPCNDKSNSSWHVIILNISLC